MHYFVSLCLIIAALLLHTGCEKPTSAAGAAGPGGKGPGGPPAAGPVDVEVSAPVAGEVIDAEVFTGRTESMMSADLKSRVSGYLEKVFFRDGDEVEAGAPLFQLELKPFELAVQQARGNLNQQAATHRFNQANFDRLQELHTSKVVSASEFEQARSIRDTSAAGVETATATLETAQQDLTWATVTAPFSGRMSRRMVDPGNTVMADSTILASLVQLDPLYVYFDVDERTVLRIRSKLAPFSSPDGGSSLPVSLGLSDEKPDEFPLTGHLKFTDNKVDPNTGTLRVWATFANPNKDLHPGLFVRVKMETSGPRSVLMISEAALGSDQGRRYVYVVDEKNQVNRVSVEVGPRSNGLIAIEKGLKGNEKIVVRGLQYVRLKSEVKPTVVEMPRANASVAGKPKGP